MARISERDTDFIRIKKSTLSWLGIFIKESDNDADNFPNRFWLEYGWDFEDMRGDSWLDKVHPDDREEIRSLPARIKSADTPRGLARYRIRDTAGNWHWILSTGIVEPTPSGGRRYVGLDVDVTERHDLMADLEAARRLAEERATEAEALRTAGAAIASSLDRTAAITRVIDAVRSFMPADWTLVYERSGDELVPVTDPADGQDPYPTFSEGPGHEALILAMRRRTPELFREVGERNCRWLIVPLVARGEVFGVYTIGRSGDREFSQSEIRLAATISDFLALAFNNARMYRRIEETARTDQLSGLMTRRAFFEFGEQLIVSSREAGRSIACVLLDIDHFKRVNDRYGHLTGDRALREVARVIATTVREDDIVGRYGGEEFCALLPGVFATDGRAVATRMLERIRQLEVVEVPEGVTASIGIVVMMPGDLGDDPMQAFDRMLASADAALYRAKNAGRDRLAIG